MGAGILAAMRRGSALALPLLLIAATVGAFGFQPQGEAASEQPHLDAGARSLFITSGQLDAAAQAVGAPTVGGTLWLIGGGATLTKPELRVQVSAWEGQLRSEQGASSTDWQMQLGELCFEQTYAQGPVLITAGFTADHAELYGSLQAPAGRSQVRVPLWGGGPSAGLRWPRGTRLGFLFRTNYLWFSGQGDWRGDQAALLGSQRFDLSGPGMTGQLELAF
jgi:hypothetical protein